MDALNQYLQNQEDCYIEMICSLQILSVSEEDFSKIINRFHGEVFYRKDNGCFFIKPINDRLVNQIKSEYESTRVL